MEKEFKVTQEEEDFVNHHAKTIVEAAADAEYSPFILLSICGAIAANVLAGCNGEVEEETVLKFIKIAMDSTLDVNNHDPV